MSRLIDLTIGIAAIIGILVVQTSGAIILDELRNEFNEQPDADFNQQEINDSTFTFVVKWVPTLGLFGVILLIGWREFQRQRITQRRGPRV